MQLKNYANVVMMNFYKLTGVDLGLKGATCYVASLKQEVWVQLPEAIGHLILFSLCYENWSLECFKQFVELIVHNYMK